MGFWKGQIIQRKNSVCSNGFLHREQDKLCPKGRQAKKVITDSLPSLKTTKEATTTKQDTLQGVGVGGTR